MDLGLSESQQMLKTGARDFLERECPSSLVRDMEKDPRGYTLELWGKIAEMGWLGLALPESVGGIGGNFADLAVLLEEMGRALLPGPFFSTVVLGAMPIAEFGSAAQRKAYLPSGIEGQTILTAALTEPSATYEPSGVQLEAKVSGDGFVLNGTKLFVPDAHVADAVLVPARTSKRDDPTKGITVFIVPTKTKGFTAKPLPTLAGDRQCEVVLKDVKVGKGAVLGRVDQGWDIVKRIRDWAAVGTCALMVGNATAILDKTVTYVKDRTQFGRPIGSFQAIQHHCANMLTDVEGARYVMYQAAWKLTQEGPTDLEVSIAKAWVSAANQRVAALSHQSHGAIGFTWEHDLGLYTRRARAWEFQYGDVNFHRELVAQQMGL